VPNMQPRKKSKSSKNDGAKCGACGLSSSPLTSCRRASWPTPPDLPRYESGMDTGAYSELLRRERATRLAAAPVKVCQSSSFRLCSAGARAHGSCSGCMEWECNTCRANDEIPERFREYHEEVPPDIGEEFGLFVEDEYGRRGRPPHQRQVLKTCCRCCKQFCTKCAEECVGEGEEDGVRCENVLCNDCAAPHMMKSTACEGCRLAMDNNDDYTIGPVDRSRICRLCFYARRHQCGCGERAWDSENSEASSESNESDERTYENVWAELYGGTRPVVY